MTCVLALPAAARRRRAWKNGGGWTSEVIAHPAGSGLDDFDWRISIAEIAEDGAFSHFDGVDRVLTILEGTLDLTLADAQTLRLHAGGDPFGFPGDVAVSAAPVTPLVRDLNVMTRRSRGRALVERLSLPAMPGVTRDLPGSSLLLALRPTTIEIDERAIAVGWLDAIFLTEGARFSIPAGQPCELVLVRLIQDC